MNRGINVENNDDNEKCHVLNSRDAQKNVECWAG
jgi:hypothetical protein